MRLSIALRAACVVLSVCAAMTACDTDAVGIEDCREIERARCRAAQHCDMGVEDVEGCERFARDNCLHGLELKETPSSTELRECVEAIDAAGACARDGDGERSGVDAIAQRCGSPLDITVGGATTACEVVEQVEFHPACQFLVAEPPVEEDSGAGPAPAPPADAGT